MNLLQMSLSGAVFVLAVALIRAVSLNRLPKATFPVLWDIALLRLLLPVTFRLPFSVCSAVSESVPAVRALERGIAGLAADALPGQAGSGMPDGSLSVPSGGVPGIPVLLMVWAAGAAVMAGYFAVSYARCRREFRTALPVRDEAAARWLAEHPLRRTVEIRQLSGLSTPLVDGVFRPVILMPKNTDWADESQVGYMLFHEYVHIRRFDALGKLAAAAALCVHWFNPLVWLLYLLYNRDMELSCDERVIAHFGAKSRKGYAMALIRMEEQRTAPASLGTYFSKNATEQRVRAIMKFRKKPVLAAVFAVVLAAAGAFAAFAVSPGRQGGFGEILLGEQTFSYVSEAGVRAVDIDGVPALFDAADEYMKIWSFAVADLDKDGEAEVILSVYGAAGDMGGNLILHRQGGRVYGYKAGYRDMTQLKADGTFDYSDPTGMAEAGAASVAGFTRTGYTLDRIFYGRGADGEQTFTADGRPAPEEKYLDMRREQTQKPDAVWHEFDEETVRAVLGN